MYGTPSSRAASTASFHTLGSWFGTDANAVVGGFDPRPANLVGDGARDGAERQTSCAGCSSPDRPAPTGRRCDRVRNRETRGAPIRIRGRLLRLGRGLRRNRRSFCRRAAARDRRYPAAEWLLGAALLPPGLLLQTPAKRGAARPAGSRTGCRRANRPHRARALAGR